MGMLERVIEDEGLLAKLEPEDKKAITPLFTWNVNPYGDITLDSDKPSFLDEAA